MTAGADVEVRLKFVDKGASSGISRYAQQVEKSARQAESAVNQSNNRQRASFEKLSHAREQLGVRSENVVQREIQKTEAAYKRLEASGTMSQAALAKAAEKSQAKITSLTNEMGKLTAAQQKANKAAQDYEKTQGRIKAGVAAGAGVAAAAYTLKSPVQQAMSFEERLALRANTAYAERDYAGRKIGEDAMRGSVTKAVQNGMTKDAAMDTLDTLISGNQVGGAAGAIDLMPFIAKVSSGEGAAGTDVASMIGGLISSGYAKNVELAKRMVGQGASAAKAGQFEMPDMARALPRLLPAAKNAGLTGEAGYKKLLVLLQQARTTAGSADEAANNVANLLAKLQSNDTAIDFKKAGRGDLAKMLMQKQANGIDPLTAWQQVINSEISKNPNLKPAMEKLKASKTVEDQDAAIEALKGMASGQSIGKYFQDMQAKGALFGALNVDFGEKVAAQINSDPGVIDKDFGYMETKSGFKTRRSGELKDMSEMDAANSLMPVLGKLADGFSDLAAKYPGLVGGATLATAGLVALASAAGLSTIAMGGGKAGAGGAIANAAKKIGGVGSGVAGAISGYAAKAAGSKAGQLGSRFLKKPGLFGLGALAGDVAIDAATDEGSAVNRYSKAALNGAAFGATMGSIIPGLGTGVGALVGGTGGIALEGIISMLKQSEQKPVEASANLTVGLAPGLVLQQQTTQSNGLNMTVNTGGAGNTGNAWTGAPG